MNKSKAYLEGYDCGLNGPNEVNSNYKIFSSAANTAEWEAGKKAGETEKQTLKDIGLTLQAYTKVKTSGKEMGTIECPKCQGTVHYSKAKSNNHVRFKCETDGCIQGME